MRLLHHGQKPKASPTGRIYVRNLNQDQKSGWQSGGVHIQPTALNLILAIGRTPTSAWPDNTVAQRAFASEKMFVEERDVGKIAWALCAAQNHMEEALDIDSHAMKN